MKLALAYFGGLDDKKAAMQKQLGLEYVVSGSRRFGDYGAHTYEALSELKKSYAGAGLSMQIIEGPSALDAVKLGLDGADEQMTNFKEFIINCSKIDVRTICYNWMPVINWYRTDKELITRGGALVTGFDMAKVDPDEKTYAGDISAERLWSTLDGFLREIIPVCEKYDVKLALHPDDPPVESLKGIDRILTSAAAFDKVLSLNSSAYNGITFCQGCFSTMGEDIPPTIKHFGDRIYFVHFRDIQGDKYKFHETFHDDGITDMYEAMKMYYEIGFDGIARPDHVPTMAGEDNSNPSYGILGNLFAVGYIKGLMEACEKSMKN